LSFIQIPNLPAVIGLAGDELFEGVQAGTSVKISLSQIIAATRTGTPLTLPILVSEGGTGVATLTGYVKGNGTAAFTASATIPNTDITGLGTMSTQNANAVAITGGSVTGITDITVPDGGTGVSTLTGYVKGAGTSPLTASATIPSTDITGLGTMSTQNANAVAITGGTINGTTIGATTRAAVSATTLNANDASVISVSSASAALTVTQTGAGAAFLVEDETSPDSTPFIVTSTGLVGIGTQFPGASLNVYNATSTTAVVSGDGGVNLNLSRATTGAGSAGLSFRKYRGTIAAPIAVVSADTVGFSNYNAWDGANLITTAQIQSAVDTFTAADNVSGILQFSTRPSGLAASVTERLRIGPAGQFGIGGANYGTSGQTIVSGGSAAAPAWGVLPAAGGGTGVTTAPAEAARILGYTSTATAAGTTVLTNTSTQYQLFTGATTQTITLPVTSTLGTGWSFHIVNNSTGSLTVNSSGGNLVATIIAGLSAMVTCIGTTLTTAADWEAGFNDFQSITGTGAAVLGTGPTITAGALNGTVGATTPSTGAFTTVTASVTMTDGFVTLAAGTLALAFASKGVVQVTPNATGTFTTTVPAAGTRCTLIVLTSGTISYTMTFGTGFKTTGTLATGTVSARYFIFQFISDGTSVIEASRTVAIA